MFERFTADARGVVAGAVEHASRAGSPVVTEEHLLLALLDREDTRAGAALASLGLTSRRAEITEALAAARRRGGMSKADEDALAGLGIAVEEIVTRVEEVHGPGALSGAEPGKAWPSGRPAFTKGSKKVLEKSLRLAVARKRKSIGDEHVLLALVVLPGLVGEVLAGLGGTYGEVEQALAP
ncbi:Clp protease N-terminal domain-containing protein [Streptomyces sp. NBC_00083]|uniref:Clp protease N-terminal domain-containing protein n=1 Tax=Streptomyces sp. NBC_00083 TaxID=2975647 RepID=UPI00225A1696|nr:Clp protease N-terminal domain-containing protein [Streptomyces sp. NBC_00083]MCX5385618.1 peptidase [Streptomyces sp. NBC_00083]